MRTEDVSAILAIESMTNPDPWTEGIFMNCLRVGYFACVLCNGEQIIGYLIASQQDKDCHLLSIAVKPSYQGQGCSKKLMAQLMLYAKKSKHDTILLEVRAGNSVAIRLYEKYGFVKIGCRKGYYRAEKAIATFAVDRTYPPPENNYHYATSKREDALVYQFKLSAEEDSCVPK